MADLFTEFVQKSGELYGTTAMDWAPYYRVGVVRFERNEKGQIAGKYRGTVVYRNKNYTNSIHEGETYIVSLESNPLTGRNYFAKPIAKLDAKFFFELTKDQIDLLAERLWESNRMAILPFLEGKYKEEFDGLLQKQREELTSEYGAKIDELTTSVADLEQSAKQDKRIIEDLQASAGVASPKKKEKHPAQQQQKKKRIYRTGPTTITSDKFTAGRYFVNLSFDHTLLSITENIHGNVLCLSHTLNLAGLNDVLPFESKCELSYEHTVRGALIVHLA